MNLLQMYLLSVGISFSAHEYLILKNNYLALKESKQKLKYKSNLSNESIECKKILNKEMIKNLLIMNSINLGFSIVPALNLISVGYLKSKENAYGIMNGSIASACYKRINEIEDNKKMTYKIQKDNKK